ncbi:MAG: IPT/TIG domain-containing protein [Acidimicrobiales bacterium]|jgi:hypothetical protein
MRRRLVVSFVPVVAVFSCTTSFPIRSNAQAVVSSGLAVLYRSASPLPPARSLALGRLSSSTDLHIDVTLKLPDPSAVASFIASLSDRHSPDFHHFLRPGQFGQLFGPPLSEVEAVDAVLRSDGLHPGQVAADRLSIPVLAPVAALDRALHVRLVDYRLPNGRTAFTTLWPPSISASVAVYIQGILGLSDVVPPESLLASPHVPRSASRASRDADPTMAGPTPCAAAIAAASSGGSHTADQLAAFYGFDPLYALGDFGQGVKVALVEFEPNLPTDVAAYQVCYGTDTTVNYIPVDGGTGSGAGTGEAALDIEDIIGLAPDATVDVYQEGNSNSWDVYSTIVNSDTDEVVSVSWGFCELDAGIALVQSESALFAQAATQGQTVFSAAGDTGSTDCYSDKGTTNGPTPSVLDPASQPYVIGVGGTSLVANSESVWNDSTDTGGAGGGGVSAAECMPFYQDHPKVPGLISSYSSSNPTLCGSTVPYLRQVPDVSADADPSSGYTFFYSGSNSSFATGWGPVGGTSAAAPLWAAAAALIGASPFCTYDGSGDAFMQPAALYNIAAWASFYHALAFNDITTGNNDYSPSGYSGGLYPATVGYDMASGLGSPILAHTGNFYPGLAAQMCFESGTDLGTTITGVSPNEGPTNESTPVTITGSGFLPVAGADELEVGATWITVSCSTTTLCTGTLPVTESGTDNLVISVEDMTLSPVTVADEFTFGVPPPPTVTGVTPAAGPALGGTKVTVVGSNFVGAVSVRFGGIPATNVHLLSSSEISAVAPTGSGAIDVTVSTAGGSSGRTARDRFTFVPAPTVAGITPTTGPAKGGTKVGIWGRNFVGTVSVRFGGTLATGVRVLSSSEIIATSPPRSGTVYVTVSAFGGLSKRTSTARYAFVAAPRVTKLTPTAGPTRGGTPVTIQGSNFVGTVLVHFGGTLATGVRVLSSSEITATVPAGSGVVYVTVSAVGGKSRRVAAAMYRY